jgi:hypothetical protein
MRSCANKFADDIPLSRFSVTIDGSTLTDLHSYRVVTPLVDIWLPDNNLLSVPAGIGQTVSDMYQVIFAPLPIGEHEIVVTTPGPPPAGKYTVTYHLIVADPAAPGQQATPSA